MVGLRMEKTSLKVKNKCKFKRFHGAFWASHSHLLDDGSARRVVVRVPGGCRGRDDEAGEEELEDPAEHGAVPRLESSLDTHGRWRETRPTS